MVCFLFFFHFSIFDFQFFNGGRVGPGALGGPWAQIWCTRGERIFHDRIHVESVTTYCQAGYLLSRRLQFGGRVGPGAPGGPWAQIWCTRGERLFHGVCNNLLLGRLPIVNHANGGGAGGLKNERFNNEKLKNE